ncbi:nephrin-like isoform X2 [Gigantopelta aegis]|uniref:nephrin-like isoform X2 n=1 Tax=Gigantopelta aegis TaxID=1735272 RepID=UPI001B888A24|nr:nephrin-like isoform X2 [Gigantopelta aegis]
MVAVHFTASTTTAFVIFLSILTLQVCGKQKFRETPQNTSVIQGQTAILRCIVINRVGNIQWTKDGFALGFDRTIPGFPRYSVIANTLDEYNLMIVNSKLEDDAEYRCQVLPGGTNNPAIQASAHLTVLVPPEMPEIEGYQNGSTVEVPHTQRVVQLTCVARKGRPPAALDWFRNGQKVTQNVNYSTEGLAGDKRVNARSIITVRWQHSSQENDAVYSCQAKNSALQGDVLSTTVQISILVPPGPPQISGYTNSTIIRVNDTIQLICTSRGGNPLATVVWYRNSEQVDYSFVSGGNKAVNEYTFTAEALDNQAIYRCEVSNVVTPRPLSAEFKLTVHSFLSEGNMTFEFASVNMSFVPPIKVTISGGERPKKAGETVKLMCVSSNSNPAAVITWFARGRQLPEANTKVTASPEGGFISTSTVKVRLSDQDHNLVYTCQATNTALGQNVADTVTLSVLYPPRAPVISGYTEGASIKAGELERMNCLSVGGNPLATIKWYKGDKLITSESKTMGNIASAEIAVVVKASDNGAVYKCTASNDATTTPLETAVNLTVLFPPASVAISVWPDKPRVGEMMNLTCVCASSNPAAEITWIRDGREIRGTNYGSVEAENGGMSTTNVLEFVPVSDDHNSYYGCRASNLMFGQAVTDALTLEVFFKPEFSPVVSPKEIDMVAGESRSLNLSAYANPPTKKYQLYREGVKLTLTSDIPRFKLSNGMLNITKIRKTDRGNFTMKATNDEGSTTFNFTISVRYAATIKRITKSVMEDEGGTAFFECIAEANPIVTNMVSWSRDDFDMSKTKQTFGPGKAYLTIYKLKREDTGVFKCTADNRIGKPATKTAKLIVKYPPVIEKLPQFAKAASEMKSTGKLICNAAGAPNITFSWSKNDVVIDTTSGKYSVKSKKSNMVHYQNELRIKNVVKADYGLYVCTAINEKGTDRFEIVLDGTSAPDPPYDIQFVNATHNSITVSWKPGFDGGLAQNFQVRYRLVGARGFVYIDISSTAKTVFSIPGLKLGKEYEITVLAFNEKGRSIFQPNIIRAKTSNVAPTADISTSSLQDKDDVPIIIILIVCIVGVFLLTLNVGLILFFIRRRRKKMASKTTFEMYKPYEPSDDISYEPDKNLDEYLDDYSGEYHEMTRLSQRHDDMGTNPKQEMRRGSFRTSHYDDFLQMQDKVQAMQEGSRSPKKRESFPDWADESRSDVSLGSREKDNRSHSSSAHRARSRDRSLWDEDQQAGRSPKSSAKTKAPPTPPPRRSSRASPASPVASNRYTSLPGSFGALSPNIINNPNYDGPTMSNLPEDMHVYNGSEMRGYLV